MTGRILGMTCEIIFIYIVCPIIYFCHIHNSLLHYIIITVIIDEVVSGFIYFRTMEKYLFALTIYAISLFSDAVIHIYFHTIMCVSPFLRSNRSQMFFIVGVLKNFTIFTGKHVVLFISPSLRSSCSQRFFIIGVLKNFAILTGKHMSQMYFLGAFWPATSLKRDSSKDVFQ